MTFTIPKTVKKVTREFLLEHNTEETYMQTYLGVPVKKGLFISPIRHDKRPTASFFRSRDGALLFHDFGIGFKADFVGVVRQLFNLSYSQALNKIASDFGLNNGQEQCIPKIKVSVCEETITAHEAAQIQIEMQDFTQKELDWWASYGITPETLRKYRVYSCKNVFLNGNYFTCSTPTSPAFGYFGGLKEGNEIWKIYFPKRKMYRFISNWNGTMLQGSQHLPKSGNFLVITKSMKDVMALHEFGIPAIAPGSETSFVTNQQLDRLKSRFKEIIVFYDNDLPGIMGMRKIKKQHPELKFVWIPRSYGAKDFSDLYKKFGKDVVRDMLIQFTKRYSNGCKDIK